MFGNIAALAPLLAAVVAICLAALIWRPVRRARREALVGQARQSFRIRREGLEAHFVRLASASGRPRGYRWVDCEFDNSVAFARNRRDGSISAFVGVTVCFEPAPDEADDALDSSFVDPEGSTATSYRRAGTAVFHHRSGHWSADGRVVFNLGPLQAIEHFRSEYESVA